MEKSSAPESISVAGLVGEVRILRDDFGIPHIEASCEADAWFGMGFAAASDRLFQMDYDRRRACGRLAEVLGQSAVSADVLARRLGLERASRNDVKAMSPKTRASFESYAAGVNAAIGQMGTSVEEELSGVEVEPWESWHSVAAFKVRHVLMGLWQHKLARAILLTKVGPSVFSQLDDYPPLGSALTVPPDGSLETLLDIGSKDLEGASRHLGFLSEVEGGSNVWAVSGSRTVHGAAVLCNDSHRALDVPNVYWQAHLSCPSFSAIGATFPGLPGFPHFGHNGSVAWAITHAGADTQDLYVETFDAEDPELYRKGSGWSRAARRIEWIDVRGEPPREIEVWSTHHGPIVHGDPRKGTALSLRWTGFEDAVGSFEVLRPMLGANNVEELLESQRGWVDPVNNLVAADTGGSIAYLTRGLLPIRPASAHRRLPSLGWIEENDWSGYVGFEEMPKTIDPPAGFVMSANNIIADAERPYISASFADPFRAERIRGILVGSSSFETDVLAGLQKDVFSWPALAWVRYFEALEPLKSEQAELARSFLAAWDGELGKDSGPALLYGCFRRALAEALYRPIVGSEVWDWLISGSLAPTTVLVRRWLANDIWDLLGGPRPRGFSNQQRDERTNTVRACVPQALQGAWITACQMGGDDSSRWRWGDHHYVWAIHPLAKLAGEERLNMPKVKMGGDSDTIQAASYGWQVGMPFTVSGLSVYRQVIDLGDPQEATWVIPGGSSGDFRSPHFSDQLIEWGANRRISMLWESNEIKERSSRSQILHSPPEIYHTD